MRLKASDYQRLHKYIDKSDSCWLWTGSTKANGYGQVWFLGTVHYAHRVMFFLSHGGVWPIELDHLCGVRNCVRPDHLEEVTHAENIQRAWAHHPKATPSSRSRKTHCPRGHLYDYVNGQGARGCRQCRQKLQRESHLKRRQGIA